MEYIARLTNSTERQPAQNRVKPEHEGVSGLVRNALLLIDNGDLRNARHLLRRALAEDPFDIDAIEWMGYCFQKLGDLENSYKCYRQLVKTAPDEFSYTGLADVLYLAGRFKEAERFYHEALKLIRYESPLLFQIQKNLGNIALNARDFEIAEDHYSRAYALNRHSDVLFVNYGTLALQKGELDQAGERFREAIQLNTKNENAWTGLAMVHWQKGDHPLALANLEQALDINADHETALRLHADWCVHQGSLSAAIGRLSSHLCRSPESSLGILLVELFFRIGNLEAASLELDRTEVFSSDPVQIAKWHEVLQSMKRIRHA